MYASHSISNKWARYQLVTMTAGNSDEVRIHVYGIIVIVADYDSAFEKCLNVEPSVN